MDLEKQRSLKLTSDQDEPSSAISCPRCGLALSLGTSVCPADGTIIVSSAKVGCQLAGRYTLTELIGEGGMSSVYKAQDALLQRTVAIKMLHQYLSKDSIALKRFTQEARTVSQLSHPAIVHIHDFGILEHGQPYIVMDYLRGESLSHLLKRKGKLPPDVAVDLLSQIAGALMHAHAQNVCHRDLKPGNIMIETDDSSHQMRAFIVDFGIAKAVADSSSARLTATGEIVGSPLYMSPEQARGMSADVRSDLYSLGCLIYEAISGAPVAAGDNPLEVLFNKLNTVPVPLRQKCAHIPEELERIVAKLLEWDADARYQSAAELLADLQAMDNGAGLGTRQRNGLSFPEGAIGKKPKATTVRSMTLVAVAALLGITATLGTIFALHKEAPPSVVPTANTGTGIYSRTDEFLKYNWQRLLTQTALSFAHSDITDAGLSYLGKLTSAVEVNLNTTAVADIAPLAALHNLQNLDLGSTHITDQSVKALSNLRLRRLIVTDDNITDKGVEAIAKITELEHVDLAGTSISDQAASILSRLPHLHGWIVDRTNVGDEFAKHIPAGQAQWLGLTGTRITNAGVRDIVSRLPQLEGISFGDSAANSETVDLICSLKNLNHVYLNRECATDTTLKKLARLKDLRDVGLDMGTITTSGIQPLRSLDSLTRLQLNYDHITDSTTAALTPLTGLNFLSLEGNPIKEPGLANIAKLTGLHDLNLSHTQITGDDLSRLRPLNQLRSITLRGIYLTPRQLQEFSLDHPQCRIVR